MNDLEVGFRTPAQRFFGPIDSSDEAKLVIREMSAALLIVSALLVALTRRSGPLAAACGILIAVPSVVLLVSRRRAAGVATLISVVIVSTGLLALQAIRGVWALLFWVIVLEIAGRASRATFKLHRFNLRAAGRVSDGSGDA